MTWYSSPALSPDGDTVFIGSGDAHLHAVRASDGSARWKADMGRGGAVECSPAVSADGSVVVVGCNAGRVRCFSAFTGELRWSYKTGGAILVHRAMLGV